jgi:amino acid adenylation domain-containing protein
MSRAEDLNGMEIAVIGMAGRFPGAANLDSFWRNLSQAAPSISFFTDEELESEGVAKEVLEDPHYVKAGGVLEGADMFDAAFFGFNAREAEITDPQQRIFLECAWEALENAGYDCARYPNLIGVYAGATRSTYLYNLLSNPALMKTVGGFQVALATDKDFLAPRVSYKLNLKGPAVVIQSACSTSLVAVHMACQSLLGGECQMALAGGVSIMFPQKSGYFYQEGSIYAPDGACRTFDAKAQGTVPGRGAGVVVLKRLEDALADGDHIRAVIKGSAINNDGGFKVGFTAPGLEGQTSVIRSAQGVAQVDPETITYIEAHGTATELGDPIEVLALTKAFRAATSRKNFCAIGSVKSNIGHTDAAAGVASLIKTILALEHGQIPASLHFERPNPKIELEGSPFYVNSKLADWARDGGPRRAGVSSFGIGGTNAHVIVEEAPFGEVSGQSRPSQLLCLCANSPAALDQVTQNLVSHLRENPGQPLADIAFTTQVGRAAFAFRRMLVCRDHEDAARSLETHDPQRVLSSNRPQGDRPVVFLFPGQGTQYPGMTQELYQAEISFRRHVDNCAKQLTPHLGCDLREVLYPKEDRLDKGAAWLQQTALAQPALFVVEYALAQLWMEWGVRPQALIGHSIGEYAAACVAGVMSLDDALALVAARGALMQSVQAGAMLAVPLAEAQLHEFLENKNDGLSLAAVNGPALTVVSGNLQSIDALGQRLAARQIHARRLHTSHAFHSSMMDPVLENFAQRVQAIHLKPPSIPIVSNVTGRWLTSEQATDPMYWVRQLRETVRFSDGLTLLFDEPGRNLLEVGPGSTLSRLAGSHSSKPRNTAIIASLPDAQNHGAETEILAGVLGRLWLAGAPIDWHGYHIHERRQRVPLPTYPFERQRYWVNPGPAMFADSHGSTSHQAGTTSAAEPIPSITDQRHGVRPTHTRPELPVSYVEPRDEKERRLAALWEELLGVAPVGIHDNFFELGGHSLLATQMVEALRQEFAVEMPLRRLFETPTVATLATAVAQGQAEQQKSGEAIVYFPTLTPDQVNHYEPFPLTDVQQAYWIGRSGVFELGDVATHAYLEIEVPNLDLERFNRSWQRLIERHDMLRALVRPDGQQQILKEVPPYRIKVLDLSSHSAEGAAAELLAFRKQMSHQVLPSDSWPLFEVRASLLPGGATRIHISFDLLIGDAWSWRILMFEMLQFYRQPDMEAAPLLLSFRDYVLGEITLQQTPLYQRALEYWTARLDSLPPAPDLPLRKSLAAIEHPVFTRRSHQVPADQWNSLKKRAIAAGLTPSGLLLAAFAETLAVWCRSPRLTINLTLFNRLPLHPEVHQLIGDFTSLTLLEADCGDPGTFEEHAQRLQRQLFDDLDHRYMSAVSVMRELARRQPDGHRAMMPVVFTSTLALDEAENDSSLPVDFGEVVYSISQTPQVLIDHQVGQHQGSLVFNWDTVEEAFPPGMLDDMFSSYCNLLQRLITAPSTWHSSALELVPGWQLQQRKAINSVVAALPDELLHDAFARRVQLQPEAPAVIWATGALTYRELDQRASQLASHLRRLGARPEKLVAICLEKSWEQVVAVLAVLRAGAAYLPVDPGLPQERRFFLLRHGEAELVITRSPAGIDWPAGVQPVCIDEGPLVHEEDLLAGAAQKPENLAYVIFTSGSTGVPKGVMIDHRGALNTVADVNRRYDVRSNDRVLALSALNFDLSVYDIFGPLSAGGAIVIPEAAKLREPAHWTTLLADAKVTIWNSVPALMQMQADYLQGRNERFPSTLRLVMLSGDWVPVTLPEQIRNLGDIQVRSLGGATEASIWSIEYPVDTVDPSWQSIPYGKAMVNQSFHVLNSRLEPCPTWTPGDLFIGGLGLARGYWKDEEKTRASFFEHPVTGARLYRTGDLGRWLPDGNIEFLGREDFQVKIQGYRIELGEIEAALAQHPAIRIAIVNAWGERRGNKRLIAYLVFEEGCEALADELRDFLYQRLPEYMIPSAFLPLTTLPLTANGKVDRSALPAPDQDRHAARGPSQPRDHVERELCRIWEQVLGITQVGPADNFFELGGHSLLAVRLMNRIESSFGVKIPIAMLFREPTVEKIATRIRDERPVDSEECIVGIQPAGSLPAFFWVHPMGGNIFCYAALARSLGTEQPFFAFQSGKPRHGIPPVTSIEEMAANYCEELKQVQESGPYLLGGWSMGGVVAFEMSRQLAAAGDEVAQVSIVDAWAPIAGQIAMESDEASSLIGFAGDLGLPLDRLNIGELMGLAAEARLDWLLQQAKAARVLLPDDDLEQFTRLFEVFEQNRRVLATYIGRSYPGRITLFRATNSPGARPDDALLGWGDLAQGGVELHVVPGNHFTMLSAVIVEELAHILKESTQPGQPVKKGSATV